MSSNIQGTTDEQRAVAPMMKCGHQANGTKPPEGIPVCVICSGINPGAAEIFAEDFAKLLEGREARCSCAPGNLIDGPPSEEAATKAREQGKIRPSTDSLRGTLAFFEYRGPGSREDGGYCRRCGIAVSAHGIERFNVTLDNQVEKGRSVYVRVELPIGATDDEVEAAAKAERPELAAHAWVAGKITKDRSTACDAVEPRVGGFAYDSFYCGHAGWD
jgi:hypothetical protein